MFFRISTEKHNSQCEILQIYQFFNDLLTYSVFNFLCPNTYANVLLTLLDIYSHMLTHHMKQFACKHSVV